jgi:STE24 endopeptidase
MSEGQDRTVGVEQTLEGKVDQVLGSGRQLSGSTVVAFIPVVLIFLVSVFPLAIVGLILGTIFGIGGGLGTSLAIFGWLLSGFLLLVRPVEERVASLVFKLRPPTEGERGLLQPAFDGVCTAAGVDSSKYILRVEDSPDVNASATGGHLVGVTRGALTLPGQQLEAVLAHELGHHRDLHSASAALGWWWSLPSVGGIYVWGILLNITGFAARVVGFFSLLIPGIGWIIGVFALVFILFMLVLLGLPFLIAYRVSLLIASGMSRALEYAADRHAVDAGYGYALREAFEGWMATGQDDPESRGSGLQRLWNHHPPLAKRIQAIERSLATRS